MPVINLPFHSQKYNDIINDCGPVSTQMILHGYTGEVVPVESYYTMLGEKPGSLQSGSNLVKFLALKGVNANLVHDMSVSRLRNLIDNEIPLIALIELKPLADAGYACLNVDVGHFVVVVGYDSDNIIIHDPLCSDDVGAFRKVPTTIFVNSWKAYSSSASAVVPVFAMGEPPSGTHEVTASALNVRSGPGTYYSIVGTLYQGQYVTVLIESNGWGYMGDNRWSSMSYMRKLDNPPPSHPSESPSPSPSASPEPYEYEITVIAPRYVKVNVETTDE